LLSNSNCKKQYEINTAFSEIDTTFQIEDASFPDISFNINSIQSFGNLNRLLSFIEKAEKGAMLKIGFIGGSITEGAIAGSFENRYSDQFCKMLDNSFLKSDFKQINAGIGYTDSRFACSRVKEDLLVQNPDLIIIDFSVNENLYDSLYPMQAFEGLVRQCLQNEDVPVLLIHFTTSSWDTRNQTRLSLVADYYSLPILSYQNAFKHLVDQGKLSWNSFSHDDIHPNSVGHFMAAYILQNFITSVYKNKETNYTQKCEIPFPFTTSLFENAGIFSDHINNPCKLLFNDGWKINVDQNLRFNLNTDSIGASFSIQSNTRELTIGYMRSQSFTSKVIVSVEGEIQDTLLGYSNANDPYMQLYKVFEQENPTTKNISVKNITNEEFSIPFILFAK
ncbi:SGNH/GDSL hydrolase family protein, partial [Bacteroidota bacterium]